MSDIFLEEITSGIDWLAIGLATTMHECAVLTLEEMSHRDPVDFVVVKSPSNTEEPFRLRWVLTTTEHMKRSYQDEHRKTDHAAMCVSILLTQRLSQFSKFTSSEKGNGFDFWLELDESDESDNFIQNARLEISGIRRETQTNKPEYRLKEKVARLKKYDQDTTPVYIGIIEFSAPKALFHQQ